MVAPYPGLRRGLRSEWTMADSVDAECKSIRAGIADFAF